jgi:hypothetical protein
MPTITLTYKMNQDDYLNNYLFTASLNKKIKSLRFRKRIAWSIFFLSLSIIFFLQKNKFAGYYFGTLAVLYFVFYRLYSKWLYKRHYKKNAATLYKNCRDKHMTIVFENDQLHLSDYVSESKILYTALEKIYETNGYFYIRFKGANTLAIPKSQITDSKLLFEELRRISTNQKIEYTQMLDWKWR